jgi:hypothetical protein
MAEAEMTQIPTLEKITDKLGYGRGSLKDGTQMISSSAGRICSADGEAWPRVQKLGPSF